MELLKRYGMNLVRLRLWNDPYSEAGEPYGAGTNDLEKTVTMARRLKRAGVDLTKPQPVQKALDVFRQHIELLEREF